MKKLSIAVSLIIALIIVGGGGAFIGAKYLKVDHANKNMSQKNSSSKKASAAVTSDNSSSNEGNNEGSDSQGSTNTKSNEEVYKIGDTLQFTSGLQVTLNQYRGPFKEKDKDVLILDVSLDNEGNQPISISPESSFSFKDESNSISDLAYPRGQVGELKGTLNPGRSLRAEISYIINPGQYYDFSYGGATWRIYLQ